MVGHTSIVYSVDAHSSGLIVSGSEDRHAKIWKGDYFLRQKRDSETEVQSPIPVDWRVPLFLLMPWLFFTYFLQFSRLF